MRNIIILFLAFVIISCKTEVKQNLNQLPKPEIKGGKPLMLALRDRKTTRTFSEKELQPQLLSNLLWAANGINRPENDGRTAPSALNHQEIEIYVATKNGIQLFDAKSHSLSKYLDVDVRPFAGKQEFHKVAPVSLILVADYSKKRESDSDSLQQRYSIMDAAYVSENIYLFCASENLGTVAATWLNYDELHQKMKLPANKEIMISQPVGYMK
jgi:nitroreductase